MNQWEQFRQGTSREHFDAPQVRSHDSPFGFDPAATQRDAAPGCAFRSETPARSSLARYGVALHESESALNAQLSTF